MSTNIPPSSSRLRPKKSRSGGATQPDSARIIKAGTTWGEKGVTPVVKCNGKRFGCNAITAITNHGDLSFMVFDGRFTIQVFLEFLSRIVKHLEGRNVFLIVERHSVHKTKKVKEWLVDHEDKIRLPDCAQVDRMIGDANHLSGQLGHFDVVNITSGLHHFVGLEPVLGGIAYSLDSDGEFWPIGEQVGRNGNRLWPEAREEANRLFGNWPLNRRENADTNLVDESLPDVDYFSACFEGVRSEGILSFFNRYFLPVEVYLRNCFLWRLFNTAYAANFDLKNSEDIAMVRETVSSELLHWANSGIGTEFFGVYLGKRV